MIVLGIETSCDETGVAIYNSQLGLVAEALYSQIEMHAEYGGVVPELASRDHIRRIIPLIERVLESAQLTRKDLDAVAYTKGPGLAGALLVGAAVGQSLALALGVPAIGVHHMEGHILAPMLEETPPSFPFIGLLVSGGHSQLIAAHAVGQYEILGDTLDDAAGEAFDKTAKMMGLGYPGGPAISKLASQDHDADAVKALSFPRPMVDRPGLDFSFSGLKTYARNKIQSLSNEKGLLSDTDKVLIAAGFEKAIVETLSIKCKRALQQSGMKTLVIAGGVSANLRLRGALDEMARSLGAQLFYARPEFCTDNGAMIAYAGCKRLESKQSDDRTFKVKPRWPLSDLPPLENTSTS